MKRYRIYTEDIKGTEDIVKDFFDSFTIISAIGVWQDGVEKAVIIEIITEESEAYYKDIVDLAKQIKKKNKQQGVLYTSEEVIAGYVREERGKIIVER